MSGLTCEDAHNLFDAHLNGELTTALETELSAHRLRCAACRHQLALLEVAGDVIAADDAAPALNEEFTSRLLACVAEQRALIPLYRRKVVRIGVAVLAAAACLAFAVGHFGRPERDVAGYKGRPPVDLSVTSPDMAELAAEDDAASAWQATFQAQVEQALTEWRENASSLQKMYQFITPQIEEMGLERPENAHDQPDLLEPDEPDSSADDAVVSDPIIEDI